jgi:hypothetical protein
MRLFAVAAGLARAETLLLRIRNNAGPLFRLIPAARSA